MHRATAETGEDRAREALDRAARNRRDYGAPDEVPKFEPVDLVVDLGEPKPYPLEALGGILGPAACAIADRVQSPAALAGQAVLGAAAFAVQAIADVEHDYRRHPTSLLLLAIAGSGERKTSVDKTALAAHYEVERSEESAIRGRRIEYEAAMMAFERARARVRGENNLSQQEMAAKLVGLDEEPKPPVASIRLMSEPTWEGVVRAFRDGAPHIGLFSSEGGEFTGGHGFSDEARLRTITGLSNVWDGSPIRRDRGSRDESVILFGRRLSGHLMLQPEVAAILLGDPLLRDQGLLNRFLAACPKSIAGSREHAPRGGTLATTPALDRYYARMRLLLDRRAPIDEQNGLLLPVVRPSAPSADLWIASYNEVERAQAEGKELSTVRGYAGRIAEQALRIAAVIQVTEQPDSPTIGLPAMHGGWAVAEWYLHEHRRMLGIAQASVPLKRAVAILDWIGETGRSKVSVREVQREGPYAARSNADEVRAALELLVRNFWIYKPRDGIDGREVWVVAPLTRDRLRPV